MGRFKLLKNGFTYVKLKEINGQKSWRCARYKRFKCKAKATTRIINSIEMVKEYGIHNHEAEFDSS